MSDTIFELGVDISL